MGKTPGKWIKTLLTKKSSKSSSLKKKEILKPADKGEAFISSNEPVLEIPVERPLVSAPISDIGSRNEIDSEKKIVALLPNPEASLLSAREDGDDVQTTINLDSLDDSQKTRHEQAATLAQAAFRGYLARRAFRTLKGIIKLQALIRGHLVRRQAVATLTCVWGIVKLQALARGQKVRRSDIGIEAQKIYSQGKVVDSKYATSSGVGFSARAEMMRKNSYIQKLLATSPTAMPLHLQYSPGEANSAEEWLDRWTRSQFWVPLPQPKKNQEDPKTQTKHRSLKTKENNQSRLKRSMRKPSNANVENGSSRSAESEKRKRNIIRNISSHATDPIQEHSPIEKEKVKRNVRKSADSTKDVSNRSEVGSEKTKVSLRKSSGSPAPNLTVTDHGNGTTDSVENVTTDSVENVTDVVVTSEQPDLETSLNLPAADGLVDELHDHSAVDGRPAESNGKTECTQGTDKELNSNDAQIKKENQKSSQRRTSLPANIDDQENGLHSTPKLPSYMAPTESAKARLRGQGSPRVSQEGIEKNGITRRLSLPSSTNGKFSTPSPRAQRLIQVTGKGAARSDRSLSASRDAGTKNT